MYLFSEIRIIFQLFILVSGCKSCLQFSSLAIMLRIYSFIDWGNEEKQSDFLCIPTEM